MQSTSTKVVAGLQMAGEKKVEDLREPAQDEIDLVAEILVIMKHLQRETEKAEQTEAIKATQEILKFALTVIGDSYIKLDKIRKKGIPAAIRILCDFNQHRELYMGDLERFGNGFRYIEVTESTLDGWAKLQRWLQALHDLTANSKGFADQHVQKDSEGFVMPLVVPKDDKAYPIYPIADFNDSFFKKSTRNRMSKYNLVINHGIAAHHIGHAIARCQHQAVPQVRGPC